MRGSPAAASRSRSASCWWCSALIVLITRLGPSSAVGKARAKASTSPRGFFRAATEWKSKLNRNTNPGGNPSASAHGPHVRLGDRRRDPHDRHRGDGGERLGDEPAAGPDLVDVLERRMPALGEAARLPPP